MLIQSGFQVKVLYVFFCQIFRNCWFPCPFISSHIWLPKYYLVMNIHYEVSHHDVRIHLYRFCFSSKKIPSSPALCSRTRLACFKASPTFAAVQKLCMSQSTEVFPYSCFYLPVCSRLVPYVGRIESFIVHYGAVQKNNMTSVMTLAS
jgi:hypothetical protein